MMIMVHSIYNNNNDRVFLLRRLHQDDNVRVIITLWTEALTFNDDEQRVQLARPELPAPHYIACTGCYQLDPHHRLGIITPDLLPVSIYRPQKDG